MFICPTEQSYLRLRDKLPCTLFPWPYDTERFEFKQRKTVSEFLYIRGGGGFKDRKGSEIIDKVVELYPEIPLVKFDQAKNHTKSNVDLYCYGDVLLCPHRVDGLGLEPLEALASGIPIVCTDAPPWNELPNLAKIPCEVSDFTYNRNIGPIPRATPNAHNLVAICKSLLGTDIALASVMARQFAEVNSWKTRVEEFNEICKTGLQRIQIPIPTESITDG
jgi:hypothetical protein